MQFSANNGEKLQREIDNTDKPAPKKRGRKRRIDTDNEPVQQSKKYNIYY